MLHEPDRHEALRPIAWDEARARDAIARIVTDTEARFSAERYWPSHPRDLDPGDDASQVATTLYVGAAGVVWALDYLQSVGAATLRNDPLAGLGALLARNREQLAAWGSSDFASYLMGDTPILLMDYGRRPTPALADRLAALIEGNIDHPARELMWGAPGTLLAALFLHERDGEGDTRWAELFRRTAARLWSQLEWSTEYGCRYWTQDLYGQRSTYLDAVHGFVATASPLIRGRHLLAPGDWDAWRRCIAETVTRTATWEDDRANWRPLLDLTFEHNKKLMQFCHGAPGFVICLGDWPDAELDTLLLAAGRATWAAGPLAKGSNLCHGTGGNGYAFLKLYLRTRDPVWLERARAFAMHGIEQLDADAAHCGQLRYSLWTGDPGFAIYLWDCMQQQARFPTLDVFYGAPAAATPSRQEAARSMLPITRAAPEDAAAIHAIQMRAFAEEGRISGDSAIPPLAESIASIESHIRRQTVLVARQRGAIVGSARGIVEGSTCTIRAVLVDPSCQGRGIGGALLAAVEQLHPEVERFELTTNTLVPGNVQFYERRGYVVHERVHYAGQIVLAQMRKPNPAKGA